MSTARSGARGLPCLVCNSMKSMNLGVGLVVMLSASIANAAPDEPHRTSARVLMATSLVTPLFGAYYFEVNARLSGAVGGLVNVSRLSLENGDWTATGHTIGTGLGLYFNGDALRAWYVEAVGEVLLNTWRHEPSGKTADLGVGGTMYVMAGYRFIHELGPVLDVGVGAVGLRAPGAHVDTSAGPVSLDAKTSIYPAVKANVGWSF